MGDHSSNAKKEGEEGKEDRNGNGEEEETEMSMEEPHRR